MMKRTLIKRIFLATTLFWIYTSQIFGCCTFSFSNAFAWRGGIGERSGFEIGNGLINIGDRSGFEIGNGRIIIKNHAGKYLLKMYDKWEVGILDKFTEVISPLYEGIPRARLQINALEDEKVKNAQDLIEPTESSEWTKVSLNSLEGYKKCSFQPNGTNNVEVRLLRDEGDFIVINLDGKPGLNHDSAFDKLQAELSSFQLINE